MQSFELPRKIGAMDNPGWQIPLVSPDGSQIAYVRVEAEGLSPMALLGSGDPADMPPEGTMAVWLRPSTGTMPGRRLSPQRWAHSAVWSASGRAVAYVANEPQGSHIVHVSLATGQQTLLGVPGAANCLPRFDGDDHTVLFCAGASAAGPFRVYRQAAGEVVPTPRSPEGADCLLPAMTGSASKVLCAQVQGDRLNWVWATPEGTEAVAMPWGQADRAAVLQVWAGIAEPVSPDRDAVLFFDMATDRVCALHLSERAVRQHRQGSIAGCWLDSRTIALATAEGVFVTDTRTGASNSLFSGQWIPCRYAASRQRLILLAQQTPQAFAIWEVAEKPQEASTPSNRGTAK